MVSITDQQVEVVTNEKVLEIGHQPNQVPMGSAQHGYDDTYSNKSTVIITDEYHLH